MAATASHMSSSLLALAGFSCPYRGRPVVNGRRVVIIRCPMVSVVWASHKEAPTEPGLQVITFQRGPARAGSGDLRCALRPLPSPGSLVGVQTARGHVILAVYSLTRSSEVLLSSKSKPPSVPPRNQ